MNPMRYLAVVLWVLCALPVQAQFANEEDAGKYASLNAAVADIGSANKTLMIRQPLTTTGPVTVLATMSMEFIGDGMIDCNAQVVTILGPIINPGNKKIFHNCTSGGSVTFDGTTFIDELPVTWWGTNGGAQINAAIAALPTSGGTVDARGITGAQTVTAKILINKPTILLLGNATFTFTNGDATNRALDITSNDVQVIGAGDTTVLTQANAANITTMIMSNTYDRVSIERVKVDGNDENQTNAAGYFVGWRSNPGAQDLVFWDGMMTRAGNRAIDWRGSDRMWVGQSRFIDTGITTPEGSGGNAISIDINATDRSSNAFVQYNYFENFGDAAIGIPHTDNVEIVGNMIVGATAVGKTPVDTESGISVNGDTHAVVIGNTLKKLKAEGIAIKDRTTAGVHYPFKHVVIANNTLISGAGLQTNIGSNTAAGTNGDSEHLIITGNVTDLVDNTTGSCLSVGGNFNKHVVITNNTCRVNTVTAAQVGILLSGTNLAGHVVTGNLTTNFDRGIEVQATVSSSGVLADNYAIGASLPLNRQNTPGSAVLSPYEISLDGEAARIISSRRRSTSDTAGNTLTLRAGGATSGATNKAGGTLILAPGVSTGTGTSMVKVQTAPVGGSGTANNTLTDRWQWNSAGDYLASTDNVVDIGASGATRPRSLYAGTSIVTPLVDTTTQQTTIASVVRSLTVSGAKTLTDAQTNLFEVALSAGGSVGGKVEFCVDANDGTDFQNLCGFFTYSAVNKAGVYTLQTTYATANDAKTVSAGTLTLAFGIASGTNKVTISCTPAGSLTETNYAITYKIIQNSLVAHAITTL